jgi:hypothetical protein
MIFVRRGVRIRCGLDFAAGERKVLRLRICFASQSRYYAQDDRMLVVAFRWEFAAGEKQVPLRLRRFGMTSLIILKRL